MGLEGTLRAFSVPDIFQMLGLQRKTGVLTIEGPEDTVRVSFLGGQVVAADSAARGLEDRVGGLLVKAGKLSQEQLLRVLQLQKQTQQRLAGLLAREGLVSSEELAEALRLQVLRILSTALSWTDGQFRFRQGGWIDSEPALSPISTESILMDAVQRMDEWPRLERKVASRDIVFRRLPGMERLLLVVSARDSGDGSLVVSQREAEVWKWVDGRRRVGEILERAFLSDFDAYGGLADLIDRDLIQEGRVQSPAAPPAVTAPVRRRGRPAALWGMLLLYAFLAWRFLPKDPWSFLLRPASEKEERADLLKAVSLARLSAIERAARVYYDSSGRYPKRLEDLTLAGILDPGLLEDPYGRPYRYVLRSEEGKFGIYGRNAAGQIDLDLSFDRTLAPVSDSRPAPAGPDGAKRKPGIQVIE